MRHRKNFNHLSRKKGHREAMFANMASSLILHKRIQTTTAKAKALRTFIEPLITKSKKDTTHSRRVVFRYLRDKSAVSELFREISPKITERSGGYTRILKTGSRLGDNADLCIIELVDYNENLLSAAEDKKPKRKRTRRAGKKTSSPAGETDTKQEEKKPEEQKADNAVDGIEKAGTKVKSDTEKKDVSKEDNKTIEKESDEKKDEKDK